MERSEAIDIPFGAFDSELKGWEYTIPKGFEARIEGNKIILELKESEDERIKKEILSFLKEGKPYHCPNSAKRQGWAAWLEKQGEQVDANKEYWRGYREGKQEILDKYATLEKQGEQKPNVCEGCNNVKGCVACVDGSEWAYKARNNYCSQY